MDRLCNGNCFEQVDCSLPFYKKRDGSMCDCTLKKCPYYIFCRNEIPEVIADCFGGNCASCDIVKVSAKSNHQEYTPLPTDKEDECPCCMETKILYKLPMCSHTLCLECYRKLYFTDYGKLEDYPPYPEIPCYCTGYVDNGNKDGGGQCEDDEYCCMRMKDFIENVDDEKWINDDAMLTYIAARDKYEAFCKTYIKEASSENSSCPLCREYVGLS